MSLFLANNADFNVTNVTSAEYARLIKLGAQRFRSLLDASDPDLRAFKDAGGKMITVHGLVRTCLLLSTEHELIGVNCRPTLSSHRKAPSSTTMKSLPA